LFYTYAHYTPEGRLFYIGKGQGDRAHAFYQRGSHWNNIVNKYGKPDIQILANWDTESEALSHEILLIECFRELGHDLCNKTNGGEGTSGYKHTEQQRENNRQARLGKPVWNKNIPCKEETKQKISVAKLGSIPWNKGISSGLKHSEEFKEKIRKTHKGNKYNVGRPASEKQRQTASERSKGNTYAAGNTYQRKWVWVGTNIKTGEVIRLVGEKALKEAGFQHANIIKCINRTRKSHKGYAWSKEKWEDKSWH